MKNKFIGGYIVYNEPAWTTSYTPGVFTLSDLNELQYRGLWPRGPVAPTNLVATVGNAQLALTWTAPATTYGTLTNYRVTYTPSGGSATSVLTGNTNTSYTLTGLTNGTQYTVTVAGVNSIAGDVATVTATPLPVIEPVYIANAFLSALRTGSDYAANIAAPKVYIANGFLSALRTDTGYAQNIAAPNVYIANGFLSVLRSDTI